MSFRCVTVAAMAMAAATVAASGTTDTGTTTGAIAPISRPYGPQLYFGLGVPAYRYYAPPRRYYRQRLGSSHVAWCYDRWLTYRAWDNTYQPSYGPRRQCWSPFSG